MGQYVNANGKKYHQQCISQDISCASCSKMIFGEVLQACQKNWHPKCFKCTLCYAQLGEDFMERKGFPYCKKCINQPSAYSGSKVVESSELVQKNKEAQEKK